MDGVDQAARDRHRRLVLVRHLLRTSREALRSHRPFSSGMAVSGAQDAVETLLRLIGHSLHAQLKESMAFDSLVSVVAKAASDTSKPPLTHREALGRLNKARVNFKHFALEPTRGDAETLVSDAEAFCNSSTASILDTDLTSVSLVDLVGHTRTENHLRAAEEALQLGEYRRAVKEAAIAFGVCNHSRPHDPLSPQFNRPRQLQSPQFGPVFDALLRHDRALTLLADGVNLPDYRRFARLTPAVLFSIARTIITVQYVAPSLEATEPKEEDAVFCCRFALEAALQIMANAPAPGSAWSPPPEPVRPMKALRGTDVLVYPGDDEVIRRLEPGDWAWGLTSRREVGGYLRVLQDGDEAYVRSDDLEAVDVTGEAAPSAP